ncbi:hypothetical protein Lal_00042713 [Lupinus albus]|nr:hypothetical protein Lal_00042713 [Lupinus albus]
MNDWAPPLIAAALFWLLSPGMLFQLPGKNKPFEFMNMKTTVASIFVHTVIYVPAIFVTNGGSQKKHIDKQSADE